ncbi:MAG: alkaline phosphatase family protein [Candidatus Hodarchaeota archaeon]
MSKTSNVDQVILIILDDIRSSLLFDLMEKRKLPNLSQLAKSGINSRNCITSYPSITFPCYSNIVIGAYSGYFPKEGSAVPLYHWLNRKDPPSTDSKWPFYRNYGGGIDLLRINKDIGKNVKTIYEQAGKGNFLSATSFLHRGSYFALSQNYYDVQPIFQNIEIAYRNPSTFFQERNVPIITVGYIPHTDDIMHMKGFDHLEYINLIIECDKYLGSLIKTLKDTGYYNSTAIAIITDHGNYRAENVIDLAPFFHQNRLIPYNPKDGSGDFDLNAGSMCFFNFQGDNWHYHPYVKQLENYKISGKGGTKINLFETLWKIPGAKLMYYRDDNNKADKGMIHLLMKSDKTKSLSKATIEYEGFGKEQKTKYRYNNKDVFNYDDNIEQNKAYTIDQWLKLTNHLDFPLVVDQIPRYFKNPRSCDIIISTLGSHVFHYEHGETKSQSLFSHDIGLRNSMVVPFIIGGSSNIPSLNLPYCKTTDMVPTLLDLLGIKPDKSVVGESVLKYKID